MLKFVNLTLLYFFLKYDLLWSKKAICHLCTYVFEKKIFLQENNKNIFVKIESNIDEGLYFLNLASKKSFDQMSLFFILDNCLYKKYLQN